MTNEQQKLTLYAAEIGNAANNGKSLADNADIKKIGINSNTIMENGPLTKTSGMLVENNVQQETTGIPAYGVQAEPTISVTQETFNPTNPTPDDLANPTPNDSKNPLNSIEEQASRFMANDAPSTEFVSKQEIPVDLMTTSNKQVEAPIIKNDTITPINNVVSVGEPNIPVQQSQVFDTFENPTQTIPSEVDVTSQLNSNAEIPVEEEIVPTFEPLVKDKSNEVNNSLKELKEKIVDQINSAFAEYENELTSQQKSEPKEQIETMPVLENPLPPVDTPLPIVNDLPQNSQAPTVDNQSQSVQSPYGPGSAMDYNTFFAPRQQ